MGLASSRWSGFIDNHGYYPLAQMGRLVCGVADSSPFVPFILPTELLISTIIFIVFLHGSDY
jgi:hypothetical protein